MVAALVTGLLAAVPVTGPTHEAAAAPARALPNIVLVLMDDASLDLAPTMPMVAVMTRRGASYGQAYVVDSLCCVSRTVILTGQYPHQTGVLTNMSNDPDHPVGGWTAFTRFGNGARSVNARLARAGYTTGFVGKFLNEFDPPGPHRGVVPPGWTEFAPLFDSAYDEWDFDWGLSVGGSRMSMRHYGAPPETAPAERKDAAYAGVFIQRRALDFIRRHDQAAAPYFLEVAVYAPHSKTPAPTFYHPTPVFPAMFRDRPSPSAPQGNCGSLSCADLDLSTLPGYLDPRGDNRPRRSDGSPGPVWQHGALLGKQTAERYLRNRARMVQSVDRMLRLILRTVDDNTYVAFTSDNGLHLDQWGMAFGKGTAYGSDTHVPLYVVGPGVVPGLRTGTVSNLDLAPTIERLAGLPVAPYRSGVSFAASLFDPAKARRHYVFTEHTWSGSRARDPDGGDLELATIPSYVGVRSRAGLLVRYRVERGVPEPFFTWELYDLRAGAEEATNVFGEPGAAALQQQLRSKLNAFLGCRGFTRDDVVPARCRALTR